MNSSFNFLQHCFIQEASIFDTLEDSRHGEAFIRVLSGKWKDTWIIHTEKRQPC